MITKAVINLLIGNAGVNALVGSRVYPNIIKENASYPAIYVSTDQMEKLPCFVTDGTKYGTIEIGVYADTYQSCYEIISAIRTAMDDYSGIISNVAINIRRGSEVTDQYDEVSMKHVKVIEYSAVAEPK